MNIRRGPKSVRRGASHDIRKFLRTRRRRDRRALRHFCNEYNVALLITIIFTVLEKPKDVCL